MPEGTRGEVSKIRAEVEILNYTCIPWYILHCKYMYYLRPVEDGMSRASAGR